MGMVFIITFHLLHLSAGKSLLLLPVAKIIFNHIWDVLKDIPSFQSEYAIILRHLLAAKDYQFYMRKRVYSGRNPLG